MCMQSVNQTNPFPNQTNGPQLSHSSQTDRVTQHHDRECRVLYSANVSRALFCWKYQLQMLRGRKKDGRFVCLCWLGLDMPREPFKPFVRLNFFLCYICRLRFKQTTSNMKAHKRYYSEGMTTCKYKKKKNTSWCKEGWKDWKAEVMRYYSDGIYACVNCKCRLCK